MIIRSKFKLKLWLIYVLLQLLLLLQVSKLKMHFRKTIVVHPYKFYPACYVPGLTTEIKA